MGDILVAPGFNPGGNGIQLTNDDLLTADIK
jgi:hypothetical protein